MLKAMKKIEITNALNAIRLAVEFEKKMQKNRMEAGIAPSAPILTACPAGDSTCLYQARIMSA